MNRLKKINKKQITQQPEHIEAFLFCPKVSTPKKQNEDAAHFFSQLAKLDDQLNECVVFLNLPSALQFSRFMGSDHVVLRTYVQHTAIEGHSDGLALKKGFLTNQHIHGCFPGWAKGEIYMENPSFTEVEALANCD